MMQNPQVGLAQGMAQSQPMRDLEQVMQMLAQGMSPEELIQMGVPEELVMAAVQELSAQATNIPPEQAGLAGMQLQQGM